MKYTAESRWGKNHRRNVQKEVNKAEAKIRQILRRRERGVINANSNQAQLARLYVHVSKLQARLDSGGIASKRGEYCSLTPETMESK